MPWPCCWTDITSGILSCFLFACTCLTFNSYVSFSSWSLFCGDNVGAIFLLLMASNYASLQSYSFRRGTYASTIFSLSFGPSLQLPDILAASSSSGSVHVFSPGIAVNQRWILTFHISNWSWALLGCKKFISDSNTSIWCLVSYRKFLSRISYFTSREVAVILKSLIINLVNLTAMSFLLLIKTQFVS